MDYYIKHNSWEGRFRKPFGAVKSGEKVYINLEAENFSKAEIVLIYFDGTEECIGLSSKKINEDLYNYFTEISIKEDYKGLINYYFKFYKDYQIIYYGNNADGLGGEGRVYQYSPKSYQITVHKDFEVPIWFKEGIVYQIFVDRFRNGNKDGKVDNPKKNSFIYGTWQDEPMYIRDANGKVVRWDFYGGNLKGVIEKLEYLKNLGVDIIYLNPIFEASSNHKYDTADYKSIDPMFGDENIFKELCHKAEQLGIKIILDGVFNHTGSDSIYFNKFGNYSSLGAYQSKYSTYYKWYIFSEYPDKYECWWGIDNHPSIDEMNEDYINFIIKDKDSVINKWMKLGISGWRLDVADELPDEFIKLFKSHIKEIKEDSVLIGEVWEDASNKISYSRKRKYLFGEELDSVTNYPFRNLVINFINSRITAEGFIRNIMSLYENYPRESFYCNLNILGTHDTERILTSIDKDNRKNMYKLIIALSIQMTMPGVPLIYYGDEAGLTGGKDPLNRKPYPWKHEDVNIYNIYEAIIKLRRKHEVFVKGDLNFHNINEDILCYERNYDKTKAIIIINKSEEKSYNIRLKPLGLEYYQYTEDLSINVNNLLDEKLMKKDITSEYVKMNPLETQIYKFIYI
ncbi:glycoside hydrolase family 13 protein [Clostridium sp. OS1-26]|uniref:glycoside hydrolase family 13 protein n=1 Tax=Clostridium sp. OS1-26 TaxID=3070681 RepID=UPI0027DF5124|nr:glycoside hydrolase family 13 protein [Clostridium sp. OS1-26]WML34947.1 glycoside hydrolase family 13 protein [Clostridium sp. OS1-26]